SGANLPGGGINIWYLEAFCRSGAHTQDWHQTVMPHRTKLISASPDGRRLDFSTTVGAVEVKHSVTTTTDEVDMKFTLTNNGEENLDLQWFEPACIRLAEFTGLDQQHFISKSFIFTEKGLTRLDEVRRTEAAPYKGGQVYLPRTVNDVDANPRPLSLDRPVNGLIGCFSADNQWLLATASSKTHELFEGVYVCLHSDPAVNGLRPHQTKQIRSKIYLMRNDVKALQKRYKKDFPEGG
ncbi:MAG: hypothetical protein JWN25_2942, partial [Verrucomicrobiales bacterium]|nr:hypothetical protein [Verrucomicrobiales bacterium]